MSGFNVEYGSVKFAIIFMAEYGIIYFFSVLTCFLFRRSRLTGLGIIVKSIGVAGTVIWTRATLPRFRYDLLIRLT